MGPDLHADPSPGTALSRCPACGGAVRPDAPWCTQCWTDLRPAEPAVPAASSAPERPNSPPAAPAQRAAEPDPAAAGWPCTLCEAVNPLDASACSACGTGFLAGLRAQEPPLLVLPVVGDLAALPRGARLGLAAAVVALALVLVALGGVLLS